MEYCYSCQPPCEIQLREGCKKWAKIAAQKKRSVAAQRPTGKVQKPR